MRVRITNSLLCLGDMVMNETDVTHCNGCGCMTHSIRKGRAHFVCGKCGHDKTLGDILQHRLIDEKKVMFG